jgi:hypothetical protein
MKRLNSLQDNRKASENSGVFISKEILVFCIPALIFF